MTQFGSSKRLCCWAGLTPGNNESAGKKKSVRISRAGVYLKPVLVQAAHAAVKDKLNPYYALKYERIAKTPRKEKSYRCYRQNDFDSNLLHALHRGNLESR